MSRALVVAALLAAGCGGELVVVLPAGPQAAPSSSAAAPARLPLEPGVYAGTLGSVDVTAVSESRLHFDLVVTVLGGPARYGSVSGGVALRARAAAGPASWVFQAEGCRLVFTAVGPKELQVSQEELCAPQGFSVALVNARYRR